MGGKGQERTDGDGVVDVLRFDNVAQEHGRLVLALYTLIVVKDDAGRVDDPQPTLELNRLQLLRMSRLPRHSAHLPVRISITAKVRRKEEADLGSLERVDQAAFADIRKADDADRHALRRARLVRFEQAEERRRSSRGEVRALV